MKIARFILLIILFLPISLPAQDEKGSAITDSSRLIINRLGSGNLGGMGFVDQDPRLTSILRKQYEFNRTSSVPGWRILIYKGRELSRANQLKAEFEEAFGQLSFRVNVEYNEPDFSTLVGAFRTKEDAYRYKQKLILRFPQAYLVQTRISVD